MKNERRMHKSKCRDLSNTRCFSTPWTSVPGIGPISASTPNSQGWLLAWPVWPVLSISQVVSPVFCLAIQFNRAVSSHCSPHPVKMGPCKANTWWMPALPTPWAWGGLEISCPLGQTLWLVWELERAVNFPPLESPTEIHEAGQKGEKITLIQWDTSSRKFHKKSLVTCR